MMINLFLKIELKHSSPEQVHNYSQVAIYLIVEYRIVNGKDKLIYVNNIPSRYVTNIF